MTVLLDGGDMSTAKAEKKIESSMSNEAFELINCFYDGVDVVVRDLAESIAIKRGSYTDEDETEVAIEVQDVKEAGTRVIEALKQFIKDGQISCDLSESVDGMSDCFNGS